MNKVFLLLICVILVFRFIGLANIPAGIYVDEASMGYNAYSLLKTGKDEYGKTLPIYLRSFGTYPPALYAYFATVPIKILGLSELSLRISPAILGLLSVTVFGIWIANTFHSKRLALLGSLFLTISPGHWLLSRGFHEPSLGFLLFLLGLATLNKNLTGSLLILSLSSYAYQPQRIMVYFIAAWVIWTYRRKSIYPIIIFLFTQLPQFYLLSLPGTLSRFSSLHINFSLYEFFSQYLVYFSPRNLFWLPDPDLQRSLPELSIFYSWQVVPFIIGLTKIKKIPWLVLLLLVSPIPAAFTTDPFATVRASLILIPIVIVIILGMVNLKSWQILLLTVFSLAQLYRSFFVLLPNERFEAWNYGHKELFSWLKSQNATAIVDTGKPVYILYLFFNKIDPLAVQQLNSLSGSKYYNAPQWENYYHDARIEFRGLEWKKDIYKEQLLAGSPLLISEGQAKEHFLKLEEVIKYPTGKTVLQVYKTDPAAKINSRSSQF